MSVDEFPQKQTAVLPYSFLMCSKLFLLGKSYWRTCLHYSTFLVLYRMLMVFVFAVISQFILIKVGLGLDGWKVQPDIQKDRNSTFKTEHAWVCS